MDINVTIKCPDLPLAAAVLAKAILRRNILKTTQPFRRRTPRLRHPHS